MNKDISNKVIKTRDELILWLMQSFPPEHKFRYFNDLEGKCGFTNIYDKYEKE